jgi:hypothetical protein
MHVGRRITPGWCFWNTQLPGLGELSYCGGYYHHKLLRTRNGWRSRSLREENVWFINSPAPDGWRALGRRGHTIAA